MKSPMMIELADLDPARDLDAPGRPDDAALQSILETRRPAVPSRRATRPAALAGAAAAVVVAVGVVATVTDLGAPPAFAGWTADATPLSAADTAARAAGCDAAAHAITEGPDGPHLEDVPISPVLGEQRGEYTYVLLTGGAAVGECLVTTQASGAQDVVTGDSVLPAAPDAPRAGQVSTLQAGTAAWSEGDTGDGAITSAYGRVGPDVVAVALTLGSGERVEATVQDGWWAVWAPGEAAFGDTVEVTLADGTTADLDLAG